VCDLETSRICASYIYDISSLFEIRKETIRTTDAIMVLKYAPSERSQMPSYLLRINAPAMRAL